ncbi:nose resistant to fluoxetine protein 6-like [Haliotis rubra]|uniref:nose resistant to fluoxetine protein 6-like n=1 Tax=Haliotis rubra TaxID=36100 RepID=UPI001EE62229|nr:nose resistant to fluoxetine protein 6-like [Haliotis rubra]
MSPCQPGRRCLLLGIVLISVATSQGHGNVHNSNGSDDIGDIVGNISHSAVPPNTVPSYRDSVLAFLTGGKSRGQKQVLQLFQKNPLLSVELMQAFSNLENISGEMISDQLTASVGNNQGQVGTQCMADIMEYWLALKNKTLWALQMADATGRPGPGLLRGNLQLYGNFDECLEVRGVVDGNDGNTTEGNHCLAFITLPSIVTDMVKDPITGLLGVTTPSFQWHMCVPKSCSEQDVKQALNLLPLQDLNMTVLTLNCRHDKDLGNDISGIVGVVILSVFVLVAVIGTLYDVITAAKRDTQEDDNIDRYVNHSATVDGSVSNHDSELSIDQKSSSKVDRQSLYDTRESRKVFGKPKESIGRKLLLAFSIPRNTEKLLSAKTSASDLSCLHGVRVLSMGWVILGHTVLICLSAAANPVDGFKDLSSFTMQAVTNGTLSVDTFFVMSGCLVALLFLREKEKIGKLTVRQMVLYYVHRFLRLTPLYMMVIMFYVCVSGYFNDGPGVTPLLDRENCRRNWWVNLLYINNVYRSSSAELCLGQSWFLANDMQFYWIAPLALIPLACGWPFIGILVIFLLLATHIISYAYLEYFVNGSGLVNSAQFETEIYFMPYCRVGVFAIGMALGYLLFKTKCKLNITKVWLTLGWTLAVGVALVCTYITYDEWTDGQITWGRSSLLTHEVLYRPAWALCVSWVILVCGSGCGGIVNSILSWEAWIPLGRLTYGAYLLHVMVLTTRHANRRTAYYYNAEYLSYEFLGTWGITYGMAFIFAVLVEAPCLGIEKALLRR